MKFVELDKDTQSLFDEISFCLNNLFGYSEDDAKKLIDYYLANYYSQDEEDLLHHEGSYRAAGIVHFTAGLIKPRSDLRKYLTANMPIKSAQAVNLLTEYRRKEKLPKILGGNAE